jgi:hypothetical protein
VGQLATLIASDRRGEAVELFQTKALGMPAAMLVISGGEVQARMLQAAQAVAAALPNAEHGSLSGLTHDINPEVLAPVLEEFVKG